MWLDLLPRSHRLLPGMPKYQRIGRNGIKLDLTDLRRSFVSMIQYRVSMPNASSDIKSQCFHSSFALQDHH
jgi:hypothetical protein